jgi:hypothetical protein
VATVGEGPFQFQHDNATVQKARSIQKWFAEIGVEEIDWPAQALTSTPNTFVMNWNTKCEPGLNAQHQCPTSLMLLWLNESIPQMSGGCYSSKGGTNYILKPMILE